MSRTNLKEFSDGELSLWVMNDEGLYRMRRNKSALFELLEELFEFTEAQREELEADLQADEEEERENL